VRTLNDHRIETDAPIEIVMWTNEEGARFAPAMLGSGVFAGAFDLEYGLSRADSAGVTVREALAEIGYAGSERCGDHPLACLFEAHIEQGPILENEEKTIGVVTGVQGMRWYDVCVSGQDTHAMTPLALRRDALLSAARMIDAVNAIAHSHMPNATSTVGVIAAEPGSRNTVPGRVDFTVDLRHHEEERLDEMQAALHRDLAALAESDGVELAIETIWTSNAVTFHEDCIEAVRRSVEGLGHSYRDIVSGAGHDSVYASRVVPTSMIFVPCAGGLSHNEAESATPSDLAAGCDVLLNAILERTGVPKDA
jgi:N-carbamoyl-L-amino-acid hydrolase